MRRIALVGFGAIGQSIAEELLFGAVEDLSLVAVCSSSRGLAEAKDRLGAQTLVTDRLDVLLYTAPAIIIEAAGQPFVADQGAYLLERGLDLHILSVGALADDALRIRLEHAAGLGGGRMLIPAGALAGFDGLRSLCAAGLDSVSYISTKPPEAWRNTLAEDIIDLDALAKPAVLLDASAREAALRFPQNANLAAAVALAGIGLDRTRVQLIADPSATGNIGRVVAQGRHGTLDVTLSGGGFGANPKTSQITGYSVIAGLRNEASLLRYL
jgi:aspartate dehydrogenase